MKNYKHLLFTMIFSLICLCGPGQKDIPGQMSQFPSPMVENIRIHERIENKDVPGISFYLNNLLAKPVEVYIPDQFGNSGRADILIHFHGLSYIPKYAVNNSENSLIPAVVNLGSGSSVYEKPFKNKHVFPKLIKEIKDSVSAEMSVDLENAKIYISSFSAGYGAVRAILKEHLFHIDGIILLDGLHTDYVPERKVLASGGKINEIKMKDFLLFARLAADGKKRFLITHSAIFPGTYASTTETADYIIKTLVLKRNPVIEWGPVGMQTVSVTNRNGLTVLGFAGNTAPDHIDHLHGLPVFLKILLDK